MPLKKLSPRAIKKPSRLKIRQRLARNGWRPVDLAITAGVSPAAVSQWFSGEIKQSERIEDAIGVLLARAEAA